MMQRTREREKARQTCKSRQIKEAHPHLPSLKQKGRETRKGAPSLTPVLPPSAEEDVLRLEVAVDHVARAQERERAQQLRRDLAQLVHGHLEGRVHLRWS